MNIKKTPASILQEMMVKKGSTPSYELIHNGGGTHQNIFTYQVVCDGLTATGTGRCKKDAKHEAATAMLELIAKRIALPQLPASPSESPVRTPLPMTLPVCPKSPANVPFRNAIGELQELCSTNNLDDPVYKEIGDVGPPHARVFTVQCLVSTFIEEGTATTKKQAKHEAARKMIHRIMGVVSDDLSNNGTTDENKKKEQMASKIAIAKYPQLIPNNEGIKSKINWGLEIHNMYKSLKESFKDEQRINLLEKLENLIVLVQQCQSDLSEENVENLRQEFESTFKSIDIQFQKNNFECKNCKETFILSMHLNTAPDILEFGIGKTEIAAEVCAVQKVIESLKFFLR